MIQHFQEPRAHEKMTKEKNAEEEKCEIKESKYWPKSHSINPHFPL